MNTADSPTLRVRGPADLLGAVPFLLGFHPTDAIAELIRAEAQHVGLGVVDTLVVTRGRWSSLGCPDTDCCPPEGTPLPATATAFDAAATYAGLVALPSRDALAEMFTPLPGRMGLAGALEQHHLEQVTAVLDGNKTTYDRSAIRALFGAQRAAEGCQLPSDEQVVRFGVALQSYTVRDALWLAADGGRLTGIELWVNLARRLPSPYNAAPLFLAAWTTYRDGNGALAGIAAELAITSDPGYSAADLLLAALSRGVDPRTLPKLRSSTRGGVEPTTV
jgi:hypothetical protein